ncbi:MAG: MGMT family protein [Ilumatobacteraceae bacterium]
MPQPAQPGPAADRDRQIIAVIRSLGAGEVVSYGDIADDAGHPGRSRLVGRLLATSDDADDLPWWRVVGASGRLVPGHEVEQAERLRDEGVEVSDGRVRWAHAGRFSRARP